MALSELEITFTQDFVATEFFSYSYNSDLGSNVIKYDCVASGATGREFNAPTPTGTTGEATAIAYETAFNAFDLPLGVFTISRALNVVTITATTIDVTFGQLIASPAGKTTTVITNTDLNPKINVRSPYFVNTPTNAGTVTPTSSEMDLFIWTGDKTADEPVTATYELSAEATNFGDNAIYFEISELVRDFITHNFNNDYPSDAVWVKYDVTTTYDSGAINEVKTLLAVDGFTEYKDGVNFVGTATATGYEDAVMFSNRIFYVYDQDIFRVPVYRNSTSRVGFFLNGVEEDFVTYTDTDLTSEVVQYAVYEDLPNDGMIDEVRVTNSKTGTVTSSEVVPVEECKYDVKKITFINKFGAYQDLWFFKANRESLETSGSDYRSNLLFASNGVATYRTSDHQRVDYNVTGKKSITLNSGYVPEDNNQIFEELFLSEKVWLTDSDGTCPVRIKSRTLNFKNRINDKLISYSVDFEYAFEAINNVR